MHQRLVVAVTLCTSLTALALPPRPTIADGIREAGITRKIECKQASPARTSSQNALYMNTRTKEIISKKETWFSLDVECRNFLPVQGYPKAVHKFDGRFQWKSLGGPWIFDGWTEWDTWLEGMPPLDKSILEKGTADPLKILDWNSLTRTTAIHKYGLRKDAPLFWKSVDQMKCDVEAEVDEWDGPDLVRQRQVVAVTFVKKDGQWEPRPGSPKKIELSRRTPSEEERKAMVNVIVAERKKRAAARLAELPVVEVPTFAKADEGRAYVYQQLLQATPEVLESTLRRLWIEDLDEDAIAAAVAGQAAFKEQYCATPTPKRDRAGFINKDDSSWTEISFAGVRTGFKDGKELETQRLAKLSLGLLKSDQLARQKSYSFDLCAGAVPKASGQGEWKVGDPVEIKYIGSWQPGVITAIVAGQIYVHDKRRDEVKPLQQDSIREPQSPAAEPAAAPENKAPTVTINAAPSVDSLPFKVGDRVEGNYAGRGRWYKGTVKDFNSARDKAFIKYDDGTSEYLAFDKVRKL